MVWPNLLGMAKFICSNNPDIIEKYPRYNKMPRKSKKSKKQNQSSSSQSSDESESSIKLVSDEITQKIIDELLANPKINIHSVDDHIERAIYVNVFNVLNKPEFQYLCCKCIQKSCFGQWSIFGCMR